MVAHDGSSGQGSGTTRRRVPRAPARRPPAPTRPPTKIGGYGWWILSLIVVLAGALALAVILAPEGDRLASFEQEWIPEYEADTPLVVYQAPAAVEFYVGTDANLDPDYAWMQSEYEVDTPLIVYQAPAVGEFFVGTDANLDPDYAWMQSEYEVDSSRVDYGEGFPRAPHYLGSDANLDPDG